VVSAAAPGAALPRPLDPVERTEAWRYAGKAGRIVYTPSYRIWTTDSDGVMLSRLPLFLEEANRHYRTALTELPAAPEGRLDTFVLSSRAQWELLTKQLMGEQAGAYLQIPRGGYASGGRAVLYDVGSAGTMAIAAHEGWHQYTQRAFRQGLPIWLEEGIATYMEGHRWEGARPVFLGWSNVERFDQLRAASAKGELMPLRALLDTAPQDLLSRSVRAEPALTYYAQVWALVHFLREDEGGRHRAALRRLVEDAALGGLRRALATRLGEREARAAMVSRRGPAVFEAYFGSDLERASERYAAFVAKIVRTGSRQAIVEGRSPVSE
jgi:hypothetical protein